MSLSGYYPTQETINVLITETAGQIEQAMLQQNIAVRHNAFTDYNLALLMCATGQRPIHDPFQSQKYFDIEQGWMLISDKVVQEERAWRIVALPEIACQQLTFYAEYLPRLAGSLKQLEGSSDLVAELRNLVAGDEKIPYFFYLDESDPTKIINIAPSVMLQRWESYWKLPLNFLRHIAANELLHSSLRADWVQIQLGHIIGITHPFGSTATDSVKSVLNKVSAYIEIFMSNLGWKALRSPVRSLPNNFTATKQTNKQKISIELGSDKRTKAREKRRQPSAPIVRQVLHDILDENRLLPSHDEFNQILQTIIEKAYEQRLSINYCLRLLYRYVWMLKGGKALLKQVARIREIEPEPSPFNENSVADYKNTRRVRQSFLDYLNSQGKASEILIAEHRIAEIIFSAALFGGLADPSMLNKLSHALQNTTYQYEGIVFVDIPLTNEKQGPVFRWLPDKISLSLILGLYESSPKKTYNCTEEEAHLKLLSSDLKLGKDKKILSLLTRIAKAGLIFDVPGHLASCLTGDTITVSLPLSQWVRFNSNLALQEPVKSKTNIQNMEDDSTFAESEWILEHLLNHNNTTAPLNKLRELGRFSRSLFAEYTHKPNTDGTVSSATHRKEIAKTLKEKFISPEIYQWSTLSLAIVGWAVHLCEHGTRSKEHLAIATIDKYVHMVIRALITNQPEGDFFNFDESEYSQVYLKAVEYEKEDKRDYLLNRFVEFHTYLVTVFSAEEPSWSSIRLSLNISTEVSYADANVISEIEFLSILNTVQTDSSLNARLRAQYIFLLILGYRFGLRSGETFRIRYIDIQIYEKTVCVIVRNSIFGETKTVAGVRAVPLLEKITDIEMDALQSVLSYSKIHFESDNQALLMAKEQSNNETINRFETIRNIGLYMKHVTGDSSLRFHHLRHSWATRMYASQVKLNTSDSGKIHMASSSIVDEFWQEFLGENDCKYPLRSIATAIGHISEMTTLGYYIHCVGEVNKNPINLDDYSITTLVYAYALAIKHGTVRARLSRENLFVISENIPSPKIKLKKRPKELAVNKNKTQKIYNLSMVEIDTLLTRFSRTRKNISILSHQLMLDLDESIKVLIIAAQIERETGFEFYRAQSYIIKNYINPSVNFFKEENIRVTSYLQSLELTIGDLEKETIKAIKTGLGFWYKTFDARLNINILADQEELQKLIECVQLVLPDVTHTITNVLDLTSTEKSNDERLLHKKRFPLAREKTKNRKNNSFVVTFNPSPALKSNQTLWRLLFITIVYLEYSVRP